MEAEIEEVTKGQHVKIIPFINDEKTFYGDVTEINPLIDEHGQVKIRARVRNADRYLMEGMSVKIILEREIKNSFVVPKDAVVLRDGFQVMFCYREGKAVWTYVDVVMSNIDSHVIKGSEKKQTVISEEDVVITPYFTLHKHRADFEEVNFHEYFDMVFFDAFAPDVQPRLWTESMLTKFYKALKPEGILTTYCVKGTVKQALRNIGFNLKRLPGPPGKREMLRAVK